MTQLDLEARIGRAALHGFNLNHFHDRLNEDRHELRRPTNITEEFDSQADGHLID